jgi:hypothetical protein
LDVLNFDPKGDKFLNVDGGDDPAPEGAYPTIVLKFLLDCFVLSLDKIKQVECQIPGGAPLKPAVVPEVGFCIIVDRDFG